MTKEYTAEENKTWRAAQPQKMIVAKVVLKSDKGNILLLKSSYKKSWQLPGGGVENKESPEAAAVREVYEETGLTLVADDLTIKGTIYKPDEEILFVIYESSQVIKNDALMHIQQSEATDFQFAAVTHVLPLLSEYYADFWKRNYL